MATFLESPFKREREGGGVGADRPRSLRPVGAIANLGVRLVCLLIGSEYEQLFRDEAGEEIQYVHSRPHMTKKHDDR